MARHIFLTGQKQVGKSTLLKKVLKQFHGEVGGFFTLRTDSFLKTAYSVHLLSAEAGAEPDDTNLLFLCRPQGQCASSSSDPSRNDETPRRFDRLGCNVLSAASSKDLIVMDELGPHEGSASLFRQAVLDTLNGTVPVFGVLQAADSDFLEEIASHPEVLVLHVTEENRDDPELLGKICSFLPRRL